MNNNISLEEEYLNLQIERMRYKNWLVDSITGLPTIPLIVEELKKILENRKSVGVLCFDVARFSDIEQVYGWEAFDDLLKQSALLLQESAKQLIGDDILISISRVREDVFYMFIPYRIQQTINELESIGVKIINYVEERLFDRIDKKLEKKIGFCLGYSLITGDPNVRMERQIYRGLKEATTKASLQERFDLDERVIELKKIISEKNIRTFYQPIISIVPYRVEGYEALSRGPAGTRCESPDVLFDIAEKANLTKELDRLCRESAVKCAAGLAKDTKLFLNIEPETINDPHFSELMIDSPLPLPPENIVFELTERTAIKDFKTYREKLNFYRAKGFKVALDDVGSGYSNLQSISELSPDYIKFDMSLVKNIDKDLIKQSLLETLLQFASQIGSHIIAEGVERKEEFETLKRIGAKFAQGFYFAKSSQIPPPIKPIGNETSES